jgi:hypothetical protein
MRSHRPTYKWPKRPLYWWQDGREHISIPFTWNLPAVREKIQRGNLFDSRPIVGGPAVKLMPEYLADIADIGGDLNGVLQRVNPKATRTTVGCPNHCGFCAVPRIEGEFRELEDWPDLPIICDNNLLAASQAHFDKVIDRLKRHRGVDFNQGLDAQRLTDYHANRLAEVDGIFRLSWDTIGRESEVAAAIRRLIRAGIPKTRISCYVLVGWNDGPAEALYRIETLYHRWGVLPNPQRYTPLDSTERRYVGPGWTERELMNMCRWGSRAMLIGSVPYAEFDHKR